VSNRRISEFPELNGTDVDEQDLLTLVHVFEVDPTLRNKKITFTQFKNYLDQYYAALDGVDLIGNVTITGSLAVNTTFSGNAVEVTGLTQLNTVTASGLANFSGIVVQNNAIVSGTVSGALVTGDTVQASNFTAVSGVFTNQLSGNTITGNTVNATTVTGVSGIFTSTLSGSSITGNTINAATGTFGTLVTSGHIVQDDLTVSGDLSVLGSGSFASGVIISGTLSGTTVTGTSALFTSGQFTNVSGTTITGNTGRFTTITGGSGVFTSQVSGTTITGNTAQFTVITGGSAGFTTVTGQTVTGTTAQFTTSYRRHCRFYYSHWKHGNGKSCPVHYSYRRQLQDLLRSQAELLPETLVNSPRLQGDGKLCIGRLHVSSLRCNGHRQHRLVY
jgi:hypothetical protein